MRVKFKQWLEIGFETNSIQKERGLGISPKPSFYQAPRDGLEPPTPRFAGLTAARLVCQEACGPPFLDSTFQFDSIGTARALMAPF